VVHPRTLFPNDISSNNATPIIVALREAFDPQIGLFVEACKEKPSYCCYVLDESWEVLWEQEMLTCKK
jgi:hypothetical protein